jgi:hypothetical protein
MEILSQEEEDMHHSYRYFFSSFVLTAALAAPLAISATAKPQDNGRQEDNHRDHRDQNKVYDRSHKDYHNWDDNEDRSYRQYLGEQHKDYRDYSRLKRNEQNQYWNWRHSHSDGDQERH